MTHTHNPQVEPDGNGKWRATCPCGHNDTGYNDPDKAKDAGNAHALAAIASSTLRRLGITP